MQKINVKQIVSNLKEAKKAVPKQPFNPVIKEAPKHRERNMADEALEMGAHGMDVIKEGLPIK